MGCPAPWGDAFLQVTEFDEQHFAAEGIFSQNSSQGHKDRMGSGMKKLSFLQLQLVILGLGHSEIVTVQRKVQPSELFHDREMHLKITHSTNNFQPIHHSMHLYAAC